MVVVLFVVGDGVPVVVVVGNGQGNVPEYMKQPIKSKSRGINVLNTMIRNLNLKI